MITKATDSVTILATEEVHSFPDIGGYLPETASVDVGVKVEEVVNDASAEEPSLGCYNAHQAFLNHKRV